MSPEASGADTLISGSASGLVDGKAGDNILYVGSANDTMTGGSGTAHVRVLFALLSIHAVLSGAEFSFY